MVDGGKLEEERTRVLREKLEHKRDRRAQLISIEEEVLQLEITKENLEPTLLPRISATISTPLTTNLNKLTKQILVEESSLKNLEQKCAYLKTEVERVTAEAQRKLEVWKKEVGDRQKKVKEYHDEMTRAGMEIEARSVELELLEAQRQGRDSEVEWRRDEVNRMIEAGSVAIDMVRSQGAEERSNREQVMARIRERLLALEQAVRGQEGENKKIRARHEGVCGVLVGECQRAVRSSLVEAAETIMMI